MNKLEISLPKFAHFIDIFCFGFSLLIFILYTIIPDWKPAKKSVVVGIACPTKPPTFNSLSPLSYIGKNFFIHI
ncbi:hypothetical protein [Malacoplasma muris]|uniref:hypothetical protein n=1 Tax=Malacoplasma muris TaxID=2119 RepID=UPI00398EB2E1